MQQLVAQSVMADISLLMVNAVHADPMHSFAQPLELQLVNQALLNLQMAKPVKPVVPAQAEFPITAQ